MKYNKDIKKEKIDPFIRPKINPYIFEPEIIDIDVDKKEDEKFALITQDMVQNIIPETIVISNYGRAYNLNNHKFLTPYEDKDGYYRYDIPIGKNTEGKYKYTRKGAHKLVLMGFDDNPGHDKLMPNHRNGNIKDNRLSNLEWASNRYNGIHAVKSGLHKMHGEANPNNKLSENDVEEICRLIETGEYFDTEIAAMFGVSNVNISDIHKGKIWTQISSKYDMSVTKTKKLTPDIVKQICLMIQQGMSNNYISKQFGVTPHLIDLIKHKKIWKDASKDFNFE